MVWTCPEGRDGDYTRRRMLREDAAMKAGELTLALAPKLSLTVDY